MTQYNTFYVPVEDGGEAQERLNVFLRGHRVLQVSRTEFAGGWGFCVEWMEGAVPSQRGEEDWRKSPRVDYREVLSAEEFGRFSKLRARRKAIAAEDGIPTYMVMTDAQLAEVAKLGSPTVADMRRIRGVGDSRIEKFAERLLAAPEANAAEKGAEKSPASAGETSVDGEGAVS